MARRRRPTLAAIRANPTLHPRAFALVRERYPGFDWHFYAQSPDSSQALALSAFLPVLEFPDRDTIFEELVQVGVGDRRGSRSAERPEAVPRRAHRAWNVVPEYSHPHLLGEAGSGEPTKVDITLVADDAVVCVESKFRVDARQGWGKCSQPTLLCNGFHGMGSDRKGSAALCRLDRGDGNRGPRYYWQLAQAHFRGEVLTEQRPGDVCPFWNDYQLMRNYLFAARYAEWERKAYYGVLGMAPTCRSGPLTAGVERFRDSLLLPAHSGRVGIVAYESYVEILAAGSPPARELAGFLSPLLEPSTVRGRRPGVSSAPRCSSA